jgi:hypothetical protein
MSNGSFYQPITGRSSICLTSTAFLGPTTLGWPAGAAGIFFRPIPSTFGSSTPALRQLQENPIGQALTP